MVAELLLRWAFGRALSWTLGCAFCWTLDRTLGWALGWALAATLRHRAATREVISEFDRGSLVLCGRPASTRLQGQAARREHREIGRLCEKALLAENRLLMWLLELKDGKGLLLS